MPSTHDTLVQLQQKIASEVYSIRFLPVLGDLDTLIENQIRVYRHENRCVEDPRAPKLIADRIRLQNAESVAEGLSGGNSRRNLFRRYKLELSNINYRHVASVYSEYDDPLHRNAVLLLGIAGLTRWEARDATGYKHVDFRHIARRLNLAWGEQHSLEEQS